MGSPLNKVYLSLGDQPLLLHSARLFEDCRLINSYVVVAHPDEVNFCRVLLAPYRLRKLAGVLPGGAVRQESVAAGLRGVSPACDFVAVHDGARPLLTLDVLEGALQKAFKAGAVIVAVPVKETVKVVNGMGEIQSTPTRGNLWVAQTPQIFRRDFLVRACEKAREEGFEGTDDASLVERLGIRVEVYPGSYENIKVTTPEDLLIAQAIWKRRCGRELDDARVPHARTGMGYDVHPFDAGKTLVLGGVKIPDAPGLAGHSDADVVIHALMDACLGAAGLPDIGCYFPPSDSCWKDADSLALLIAVRSILAEAGFEIWQADVVIAAETPRLAPYLEKMKERLSAVLGLSPGKIGIKATTTEGLGFVGRREGIAAWALATVVPRK